MADATHAGVLPPPELVAAACRYVEATSLPVAAKKLGIAQQSLAKLCLRQRMRRGTVVLAAQALGWPGTPSAGVTRAEQP